MPNFRFLYFHMGENLGELNCHRHRVTAVTLTLNPPPTLVRGTPLLIIETVTPAPTPVLLE